MTEIPIETLVSVELTQYFKSGLWTCTKVSRGFRRAMKDEVRCVIDLRLHGTCLVGEVVNKGRWEVLQEKRRTHQSGTLVTSLGLLRSYVCLSVCVGCVFAVPGFWRTSTVEVTFLTSWLFLVFSIPPISHEPSSKRLLFLVVLSFLSFPFSTRFFSFSF